MLNSTNYILLKICWPILYYLWRSLFYLIYNSLCYLVTLNSLHSFLEQYFLYFSHTLLFLLKFWNLLILSWSLCDSQLLYWTWYYFFIFNCLFEMFNRMEIIFNKKILFKLVLKTNYLFSFQISNTLCQFSFMITVQNLQDIRGWDLVHIDSLRNV